MAGANAFPITATSGDWTAPLAEIRVGHRAEDDAIRVHAESDKLRTYYTLELSRHDGKPITPGTYTDQKVLVINRNLGCIDDTANFTVERLDANDQGIITAFDGTAEHTCGDQPDNALRVKVHYQR